MWFENCLHPQKNIALLFLFIHLWYTHVYIQEIESKPPLLAHMSLYNMNISKTPHQTWLSRRDEVGFEKIKVVLVETFGEDMDQLVSEQNKLHVMRAGEDALCKK